MKDRLRSLFGRVATRQEVEDELRSHVEHYADELESQGLPRSEAKRQAWIAFGGFEHYREEAHATQRWHWAELLARDLWLAVRTLKNSPGFTLAAVLTLALGIGANAALFSLVRGILLHPAPIRAPQRVVVIWDTHQSAGLVRVGPDGQDYLDWKEQKLRSFEDFFLFEHGTGTVTGAGDPEQVTGLRVTTNFADFFGIQPLAGRAFLLEEQNARHNSVMLSDAYWERKYKRNPAAIGQTTTLNQETYTIIGVIPQQFAELFPVDVVVPFDNAWLHTADSDLGVFGRLAPHVTLGQASAEMNGAMAQAARQRLDRKGFGTVVVPLQSVRTEFIRPALLVLQCAVAFILLLACANVASLMLARSLSRQREVAVRISLGAGRKDVIRQFLVESALLAMLGGAFGMLIALAGVPLWSRYGPAQIPVPNAGSQATLPPIHIGPIECVFTFALSLVVGIAFGLMAPLRITKGNLQDALKIGGRGTIGPVRGRRARTALIITEGALALLLVVGALLMSKSFSHLLAVDPGFTADSLLTLRIKLSSDAPNSPYRDRWKRAAAFHNFLDKVRSVPGVQSAGLTTIVPLSQDDMARGPLLVPEKPELKTAAADYRSVSPEYLGTMRVPILAGRNLQLSDDQQRPWVVVIDQTLAHQYFGHDNPIGKHIIMFSDLPREIVGVAGAVRDETLSGTPEPTIYVSYLQAPEQTMSLVVRSALPLAAILPGIRSAIWSVDRDQPVFEVKSMQEIVGNVTSASRIAFVLLDVLAAISLALAAIGIYGVTAYNVGQRTREIGVRTALGGTPRVILIMMMRQQAWLTCIGASGGLVCAFLITRMMSSLLYGVSSTDPATFVAAALSVSVVAMLACYLPARRAVNVDPLVALRAD